MRSPPNSDELVLIHLSAIELLLERIADRVAQIAPSETTTGRSTRSIAASDLTLLHALLPAITSAVGDANWTAGELFAFGDPALVEVLANVVPGLAGSSRTRRLGRLLARAEGREILGRVVLRVGPVRGGVLWRVRVLAHSKRV